MPPLRNRIIIKPGWGVMLPELIIIILLWHPDDGLYCRCITWLTPWQTVNQNNIKPEEKILIPPDGPSWLIPLHLCGLLLFTSNSYAINQNQIRDHAAGTKELPWNRLISLDRWMDDDADESDAKLWGTFTLSRPSKSGGDDADLQIRCPSSWLE